MPLSSEEFKQMEAEHTDWMHWRVEVERRITRLETKMNLIAFLSGATFLAVLAALVKLFA